MLVKFKCFRRRSTDLFSYLLALLKVSVATNDHVDLIKRSNDDDDDEEKNIFPERLLRLEWEDFL